MLLNACLILLHTLLYTGCGWLALRLMDPDGFANPGWGKAFWAGWAAAVGLLQLWHFFFAVNFTLYLLLGAASALGWALYMRQGGLKALVNGDRLVFAVACLVPLAIMANHVIFSEPSYDHGLYHLQTVKWFNAYPVVRGLGNLHHRLAFNSSNSLVGALLNSGPLAGYGVYSANSTVMFALAAQGMWTLSRWLRDPRTANSTQLFGGLLLPATLWQASQYPLSGYSADTAVFALQATLAVAFLELAVRRTETGFFGGQSRLIVMLIAAGVTVKLSFAAFGAALLTGMLILWLTRARTAELKARGTLLAWAVLLATWILPWLVRNILMSGYPLYPSSLFGLPVAWRMPGHLIADISAGITEWARTYSGQIAYTGDTAWLTTWALRFVYEPRQALILSAVLLMFCAATMARMKMQMDSGLPILLSACALSIVFWFLSAPTYRFSGAAIWILYAGAILGTYRLVCHKWGEKSGAQLAMIALLFLFYSLRTDFSKNISPGRLLAAPREEISAEQAQPLAGMQTRVTQGGLQVYVPPDSNPETCWNTPLPCTTRNDYLDRLSLLEPGDLGSGFYLPDS